MNRKDAGRSLIAACLLAVALCVGLAVTPAGAKKKGKTGGTVDVTKPVGAPVPDASPTTNGLLVSTIDVGGKRFKGARVRDVNVTVQSTGDSADAAGDLSARLTAPNGATSWLFNNLSGRSIGPLTLDDQSANFLLSGTTPPTPTALTEPFAGTAQPDCLQAFGGCPLAVMNGGPATGTWTLRVYDEADAPGDTSVFNTWRLTVVTGKAYRTK